MSDFNACLQVPFRVSIWLPHGYKLHVLGNWFTMFEVLQISCDLTFKRFYSFFKLISRICFGYTLHIFGSSFTAFWVLQISFVFNLLSCKAIILQVISLLVRESLIAITRKASQLARAFSNKTAKYDSYYDLSCKIAYLSCNKSPSEFDNLTLTQRQVHFKVFSLFKWCTGTLPIIEQKGTKFHSKMM